MQGIGKAVVEELAALGCRVFTCARSEKDLSDCLVEWKARYVVDAGVNQLLVARSRSTQPLNHLDTLSSLHLISQ